MTSATLADALAYYARHHCSLFPMPAGSKSPTGIVDSFAHDHSTDPAVWDAWRNAHPGCNFGVVAGPSRLIIVDVDVSKIGRDAAWAAWCEWCADAGIPVAMPHVQSARGGWHIYFSLPDDAPPLRQVRLAEEIDLRVGNGFTVTAGSHFAGSPYILLSDAPPHPAPAALLAHAARRAAAPRLTRPGDRDRDDVASLLSWLTERDAFAAYEDWLAIGMALKIEFGDDGLDLWEITFDGTVTDDVASGKWDSFASDPGVDSVTLSTFLDRAHKMGWRGTVRRSAASMFGEAGQVAALAAAAGATLPAPVGAVPMLAGQEALAALGEPILREFLAATADAPTHPTTPGPALPDAVSGHGLYPVLQDAIGRILAMAESGKTWRKDAAQPALAILHIVHAETADAVMRRVHAAGRGVSANAVKLIARRYETEVRRQFIGVEWQTSPRTGEIEHDNSDNVSVFLGEIGAELRWNAWLNQAEIRGGSGTDTAWPDWTRIDDTVIAKIRTRATQTGTRFRPSLDFLRDTILTIACREPYDPVLERIDALADAWDGRPRLAIWLTATCGVPCDLYHQAVGRNIIGGMVRRARHPGCKHDEVAILIGPQGTRKSTLARALALSDEWFSDSVSFDGSPQNVVPQLFGKLVIELAELDGMQRREVQHVKRFLSAQTDSVTLKFKAFASDFPRRCIFLGTSNDDAPLMDSTGNRRFLPVRVHQEIDTGWLAENIGQLVGEAARLEAAGETFGLPRTVWAIAAEHQESARNETDTEIRFADWFAETPATGPLSWILASDLTELCEMANLRGSNGSRGAAMKTFGFRKDLVLFRGKRARVWVRGQVDNPTDMVRLGTRYCVAAGPDGRPRVTVRREGAEGPLPV